MQYTKGLILIVLHFVPVLFVWWARGLFDAGANVQPAILVVIACLCVAATMFRGLHIEERNEDLEPYAPTPQWPKRLPRWARDAVPPTNPPPVRTLAEEPKIEPSGIRPRLSGVINWPDEKLPSVRPESGEEEDTITDTLSDEAG